MINTTYKKYDEILKDACLQINAGNIRPIEDIIKLAQKGYPHAEFILGELNEINFGNEVEAAKWYKAAAAHGHEEAQRKYVELTLAGERLSTG